MFNYRFAVPALIAALLVVYAVPPVSACSAFVMADKERLLFGRNFDFFTGSGFFVVNPRNLVKTALVYPGNPPAQWQAKYGSVTFNQLGREFPMGGMNEKGLVLECLWLPETRYPDADARATLTELQWIQYILDNCQSVAEALAADVRVRILPSATHLHFLLLDRSGAAGVMEFIGGKSVLYGGDDVPIKALTNASYATCREFVKRYQPFGGKEKISPAWRSNGERFALLAARIRRSSKTSEPVSVERAFALLNAVHYDGRENPTQWRIVYDPLTLQIHFLTKASPNRRILKFDRFSWGCGAAVKTYDLSGTEKGDLFDVLVDYAPERNLAHTRAIFAEYKKAHYAADVPEIAVMLVGNYPQTVQCR